MHFFIIGATGYIGSKVAKRALADGHQVTGFARNATGVEKLRSHGVVPLLADIADLPTLAAQAKLQM